MTTTASEEPPGTGAEIALRPWAKAVVAGGALVLVLAAGIYLLAAFLWVAPVNTVTTRYSKQIDNIISPWAEQNWQLFAPNPVSQNIRIEARTKTTSGTVGQWVDLSADDYNAIKDNPFPSHSEQNLMRRSWDMYNSNHSSDDQGTNNRSQVFQDYLRNIAVERIGTRSTTAPAFIQLRVTTTNVPPPGTPANAAGSPSVRTLPWWGVA